MHECSYQGGTAWAEPSILRLQAFSQQNKKLSLDNLLELRGALLSSTGTVCFPWALTTGTQHFCSILQLCSEHLTHRKLETKGAALRLENIKGAAAVCFVSLHKCSVMENYWHSGLCCVFLPLSSLLQPHNSSFLQLKLQDRQSSRSVNNDIFFLQKKNFCRPAQCFIIFLWGACSAWGSSGEWLWSLCASIFRNRLTVDPLTAVGVSGERGLLLCAPLQNLERGRQRSCYWSCEIMQHFWGLWVEKKLLHLNRKGCFFFSDL